MSKKNKKLFSKIIIQNKIIKNYKISPPINIPASGTPSQLIPKKRSKIIKEAKISILTNRYSKE